MRLSFRAEGFWHGNSNADRSRLEEVMHAALCLGGMSNEGALDIWDCAKIIS